MNSQSSTTTTPSSPPKITPSNPECSSGFTTSTSSSPATSTAHTPSAAELHLYSTPTVIPPARPRPSLASNSIAAPCSISPAEPQPPSATWPEPPPSTSPSFKTHSSFRTTGTPATASTSPPVCATSGKTIPPFSVLSPRALAFSGRPTKRSGPSTLTAACSPAASTKTSSQRYSAWMAPIESPAPSTTPSTATPSAMQRPSIASASTLHTSRISPGRHGTSAARAHYLSALLSRPTTT